MNQTLDLREFQGRLERLDGLLREAERSADPAARAALHEIVQTLLSLHGAGLGRIMDHINDAGKAGADIRAACMRDSVVGGLLLLHGLHPDDLETRVADALDSVRPYLRSHGGNVELLGVAGGVVRLRLGGSCHGCPTSSVTMQQTIEEAIYARAPEVAHIEVVGQIESAPLLDAVGARVALPVV